MQTSKNVFHRALQSCGGGEVGGDGDDSEGGGDEGGGDGDGSEGGGDEGGGDGDGSEGDQRGHLRAQVALHCFSMFLDLWHFPFSAISLHS